MIVKYKPKQKVKTVSWSEWWVNYILVFDTYITYNLWDGGTQFLTVDEWQISCSLEQESIWFNIELWIQSV